uniref:Uncharacterized protein n=1 Tax=Acrobeloides nanus TaxID=290746 RepID=A0A914E6F3_9BILA
MAENDREEDLMAEFFVMSELEEGEVLSDEDIQEGLDQAAEEEIARLLEAFGGTLKRTEELVRICKHSEAHRRIHKLTEELECTRKNSKKNSEALRSARRTRMHSEELGSNRIRAEISFGAIGSKNLSSERDGARSPNLS